MIQFESLIFLEFFVYHIFSISDLHVYYSLKDQQIHFYEVHFIKKMCAKRMLRELRNKGTIYFDVPVFTLIVLNIVPGLGRNRGIFVHNVFIHHSFSTKQRETAGTKRKLKYRVFHKKRPVDILCVF